MTPEFPFCSVIVPTYSRPKQLAACLTALSQLEYPADRFEVIVVDDGSTISPSDLVSSLSNRINIRLIVQRNGGPASARNMGAVEAKGEFLAFTDDDCLPASDWLTRLACRYLEGPEKAIGGRTVNHLLENPYSTASQMLIEYLYRYFNPDRSCKFRCLQQPGFSCHVIPQDRWF